MRKRIILFFQILLLFLLFLLHLTAYYILYPERFFRNMLEVLLYILAFSIIFKKIEKIGKKKN